ncbi:MAG: hypothetical protein HFI29_05635 [Lachnospiraceae bacterium]|jgi:hypothetical protein|nr:hypothetical protein [Lachnospiraceae bacterium]
MKESKFVCFGAIIFVLFCGMAAIIIEWRLWGNFEISILGIFSFLRGHRTFLENILLGIFASGILLIYTSFMQYKIEYKKIKSELIISYICSYLKIKKCREEGFTYEGMLSLRGELEKEQGAIINFSKEFFPFMAKSLKNKKLCELEHICQEMYFSVLNIDVWKNIYVGKEKAGAKERAEQSSRDNLEEVYIKAAEINNWLKNIENYKF